MAKKLYKKRNQKLNMVRTKSTKLEKGLGIKSEDWKQVAVKHVIDVNKRSPKNSEPKFSG